MANKAIEFAKVKDETLPRQSTTYDTNYWHKMQINAHQNNKSPEHISNLYRNSIF
jgi:hypothetical protein